MAIQEVCPKWPRRHEGRAPKRRGKKIFESADSRRKTRKSPEKITGRRIDPSRIQKLFFPRDADILFERTQVREIV